MLLIIIGIHPHQSSARYFNGEVTFKLLRFATFQSVKFPAHIRLSNFHDQNFLHRLWEFLAYTSGGRKECSTLFLAIIDKNLVKKYSNHWNNFDTVLEENRSSLSKMERKSLP